MIGLHVRGGLSVIDASDWLFVVSNVAIMLSYLFIAMRVVPIFPVCRITRYSGFAFFVLCASTHADQILHTIGDQGEAWGDIVEDLHMFLIHVPQGFAVIIFAMFWFKDMRNLAIERGTVEPAEEQPQP